ncbi:MAG: glycoside hydrolase [Prevotellaceae bacterium]|nr:glycoside hydrolase [Prevotellaceae bacterium]
MSLAWWAAQCGKWPEEQLDSLVDWLVSPDGLNYSVFRYNIGAGDDPAWTNCDPHHFSMPGGKGLRAEMEVFKDGADEDYNWNRDEAQRRVLLMIHEKRPDAVFEAFANSAPWWMTVSGCSAGAAKSTDDNLSPTMYSDFANFLVDVCTHFEEEYGIHFSTLDPFNEPMTDYWYQNGSQEGCHFSVDSQIEMVRILAAALDDSELETRVSVPDETSVAQAIQDIQAYRKAGVLPLVGQWNTHTYKGTQKEKAKLAALCDTLGIRLWQSETGDGGRGLMGNLRMAQRLVDDIRYLRPAVWCDWQYVEQNYDQWSLVTADKDWAHYSRNNNYYVRSHFSRFVPAGYRWLDIADSQGLAAVSPDGARLVYVTINVSPRDERRVTLALPDGTQLQAVYRTSQREHCQQVSAEGEALDLPPMSIITAIYSL